MQDTFLPTFKFLFERMGMKPSQFVDYINTQPLPEDFKDHPPYRHLLPLSHTTVIRILSGSIPDPDTLYRIARLGFGFDKEKSRLLEDIRHEAYVFAQEERRTTQQMAAIKVQPTTEEFEVKVKAHQEPKIPSWIHA